MHQDDGRGDLVSKDKILEGKSAVVRCANGDTVLYPLVQVCIEVDGCVISTVAVVSDTLPMAVLLGVDVPELSLLLLRRAPKAKTEVSEAFVTTRTGLGGKQRRKGATRERMSFLKYDQLLLLLNRHGS